jgi:hypothetical protein
MEQTPTLRTFCPRVSELFVAHYLTQETASRFLLHFLLSSPGVTIVEPYLTQKTASTDSCNISYFLVQVSHQLSHI